MSQQSAAKKDLIFALRHPSDAIVIHLRLEIQILRRVPVPVHRLAVLVLNLESNDRISEEEGAEPRSISEISLVLVKMEARFHGALNTLFVARTMAILAVPVFFHDMRCFLTEVVNLLIDACPQVFREEAECCSRVHKAVGRLLRAG